MLLFACFQTAGFRVFILFPLEGFWFLVVGFVFIWVFFYTFEGILVSVWFAFVLFASGASDLLPFDLCLVTPLQC